MGQRRGPNPFELIVSGASSTRFPSLNFVSVESGFGYLPYLLEDDWTGSGSTPGAGARQPPDRLLPSEYFKCARCTARFWFEHQSLTRPSSTCIGQT